MTYGAFEFTAPEPMFEATVPALPGLFAIQVQRPWWRAGGMQPIQFGASDNLHEHLLVEGHDDFVAWLSHHRCGSGLYISVCVLQDVDHAQRHGHSAHLHRRYLPRHTHSVEDHLQGHVVHGQRKSTQRGDSQPGNRG